MSVHGQELIDGRAFLDACEAKWLVTLAEFDTDGSYELDGHVSCVTWLVDQCGMARSTAKEKVRVAHELRRRPVVGDAFVNGELTYSKARILTRLVGLDDERDAAFISECGRETADMLERLVRYWNIRNGGDEPEPDPYDKPRVRFEPGFGSANGRIVIEGPNEDLSRLMNIVDAYGSYLFFAEQRRKEAPMEPPVEEAPMEPVLRADNADEPARTVTSITGEVLFGWAEPTRPVDEAPMEPPRSLAQRRYDWVTDLLEEVALVRADQLDPARATVGVTVAYESLVDKMPVGILDTGTLLTGEAVRRVCCDADISRMVTKGASEILDLGRNTKTWNRAQRRAARFRHGNKCAVRGCDRRITQLHHMVFWSNDGHTGIENAIPLCARHHHMVHDLGWTVDWKAVPCSGALNTTWLYSTSVRF